ncbi:DNA-binding response regulator [Burkholderia sp. Bp9002]|nr:DNA-binding response regulator [Burkholderia sp. Bp9002]
MIEPFAFPTTVGFIDDSASFFANLSLQLDTQLAFRFFHSAERAISVINDEAIQPLATDDFLCRYHDRSEQSDAHEVIAIRIDAIQRQMHNARRFERTSVVVVDYDMPGLNGLEVCRRIANPAVKKIMLTGKADEQLAVKSFNQGLIDRFIRKQDVHAVSALNEAIDEMKRAYLRQTQRTVIEALGLSEYRFLVDPAFAAKVSEIFCELGIVEHYLSTRPTGLVMLDSAGTPYLLLVHTEDALRATREIAVERGAPAAFLAELDNGHRVPYFPDSEGYYPLGCTLWQPYMHSATVVRGQHVYTCSVIKNPPGLDLGSIVSYDAYLERLDHEMDARGDSRA